MPVESSRSDAQGTVGDGRERELSDVAGTLRRSDTTQQGVAAAVSFTIARPSTTSVQVWQEGQGEFLGLILAELQDARQRQTSAMFAFPSAAAPLPATLLKSFAIFLDSLPAILERQWLTLS